MRRLVEKLRSHVEEFVEQRDDLAMLLACSDDDVAIALKTVRDVEMASDCDLFVLTADPFRDAASFVDAVVRDLRAQHALARDALVEAAKPPLPAFPEGLARGDASPAERLRATITFARSLAPPDGGHRLVWAAVPIEITDRVGYLALLASLLPEGPVAPWMRGVRLILRVPRDPSGDVPAVRAARTRVEPVDFSPAAIQRSLDEEAHDAARPDAERMQALTTSAWLDSAKGETARAVEKFQHALGYYQQAENTTMQAIVMHGMGDAFRLQGAAPQALHWYECALEAAVTAGAPVVIATVGWSLGAMAYEGGRYDDAARYYDGLDAIASQLLDAEQKARAMEWRGLSQEKLGLAAEAIASWEAACALSRNVGLDASLRANLGHIERASAALGDDARADRARAEREALPPDADPHAHAAAVTS